MYMDSPVTPAVLTDTELLYLRGLVSNDIDAFEGTPEDTQQRSRFTNAGLADLYTKLDDEVAKRELDA